MKSEIIKAVYNDVKYLFVRTKVFRERIENESSKLSVYVGKLINAVNYLSNLSTANKIEFISSNQSISSDISDLSFVSIDNNSLYSIICSINEQLQNIEQKHKEIAEIYLKEHVSLTIYKDSALARSLNENQLSLKSLILSAILPCAMLIKSINLYSNIRYGKNPLSKYHSDMLNNLTNKAEYDEKKNLVSLHESIDTVTNSLQIKTVKEIKDKEFSTKEMIKGWICFLMSVSAVSITWTYAPRCVEAIKQYFIQ